MAFAALFLSRENYYLYNEERINTINNFTESRGNIMLKTVCEIIGAVVVGIVIATGILVVCGVEAHYTNRYMPNWTYETNKPFEIIDMIDDDVFHFDGFVIDR